METELFHLFQKEPRWSCLEWAVSGEQRGSSGHRKEFIPPRWATVEGIHLTPHTRRCAQDGTHRGGSGCFPSRSDQFLQSSQSLLGKPRPDSRDASGERCRDDVPLCYLHLHTAAAPGSFGLQRSVREEGVGSRDEAHRLRTLVLLASSPEHLGPVTGAALLIEEFDQVLTEDGFGPITTEITEAKPFYYAEDYHQQYLSKNPDGYCGLRGTGISCPVELGRTTQ
ncbi:mitochondrial peptide methionine sulfoxide reductase isoform X2 [Nothobranchius furzeri]|uniref:mitochondrial peptide methionine sulfoxide reductase isoform X2 n=1 Tax=Nothobranchius furzeri TaxID=105023 RepID=UPI003904739F